MQRFLVHSSSSTAKDKLESSENRARLSCSVVSPSVPHPTTDDLFFSIVVDEDSYALFTEGEKVNVFESFESLEAQGFKSFLKTQDTEPTAEELSEAGANTFVESEGTYYLYNV